jgi:hypothetical protein
MLIGPILLLLVVPALQRVFLGKDDDAPIGATPAGSEDLTGS